MIPRIIHRTTANLTWEEARVFQRGKAILPDYEHRLWTDADNDSLFGELFPQYFSDYKALAANVSRADLIRCCYLYKFGGIYCDTDYLFYKRPDNDFHEQICVLGIEELNNASVMGGYKAGNAFMASVPGFDLWPRFIEHVFAIRNEIMATDNSNEGKVLHLTGPHSLTKFIKANPDIESRITFMTEKEIYPPFTTFKTRTYRGPETIGAHLCWGGWRNKPLLQKIKSRARRIISAVI